jgi:hypothetical protein
VGKEPNKVAEPQVAGPGVKSNDCCCVHCMPREYRKEKTEETMLVTGQKWI